MVRDKKFAEQSHLGCRFEHFWSLLDTNEQIISLAARNGEIFILLSNFERMNRTPHPEEFFKFRLYITGNGPSSKLAVANLSKLCQDHLPMRHEIEIVDVLTDSKRALEDGVFLTPLLIKLAPGKVQKILGNLVRPDLILSALDFST